VRVSPFVKYAVPAATAIAVLTGCAGGSSNSPFASTSTASQSDQSQRAFRGPVGHRVRPNACPPVCGTGPAPADPLFVADPTLNAIVVYDSTAVGATAPVQILAASPTTQLKRPSSVAVSYLTLFGGIFVFVTNNGNDTITSYEYYPGNGSPRGLQPSPYFGILSTFPNCAGDIDKPHGIVHYFDAAQNQGYIFVTNKASNIIAGYYDNEAGATCADYGTGLSISGGNTTLASPRGPSIWVSGGVANLYNTNFPVKSVTQFTGWALFTINNIAPASTWVLGKHPEGTAVDPTPLYLWVSTSKIANIGVNALWRCTLPANGSVAGCPAGPCISGAATTLRHVGMPSVSPINGTIFAPNHLTLFPPATGYVTKYPEGACGNAAPTATFTGLTKPVGTAVYQ
jgi:hypothetical protein